MHQFMVILTYFKVFIHFGQSSRFQHFKDQNRVMGSQRAATLGDYIGMGNVILVTGIHQCRNRVVHILLNGIVHTAFTVGRTRSVIVHAQTTANVYKLYIEAHSVQLHIEL